MAETTRRTLPLRGPIVFAFTVLLLMITAFPWRPELLKPGLDPSFRHAQNVLYAHNVQFGSDVVCTHGPLGFARNNAYHPDTFTTLIVVRLLALVTFAALATRLALDVTEGLVAPTCCALAAVALAPFGDAFFTALAMLAFLVFWWKRDPIRRLAWSAVTLAIAAAVLIKFTYAFTGVILIGLMVAAALIELGDQSLRGPGPRSPLRIASIAAWPAAMCVAVVALWILSGQELAGLPAYLHSRLAIASTYAESHARFGPWRHVFVFVVAGSTLWTAVVILLWRGVGRRAVIPAIALGCVLFFSFKHGFTRHDLPHIMGAGLNLLSSTLFFGCVAARLGWRTLRSRTARAAPALALVIVVMAFAVLYFPSKKGRPTYSFFRHLDLVARIDEALSFLREPWLTASRYESAKQSLRLRFLLPRLDGTVDLYPCNLVIVFANDLQYKPRTTVQSHMAMTSELARTNAQNLEGSSRPDHVLFGIRPIDYRFPSIEDGPSWPLLISGYRPRGVFANHLVLDRTDPPRRIRRGPVRQVRPDLGSIVQVETAGFVWARVDLRETLLGRLFRSAFKGSVAWITVGVDDGSTLRHRLPQDMARAGFLLSPLVTDPHEFASLWDDVGTSSRALRAIRWFRIDAKPRTDWYFRRTARVELSQLSFDPPL